MNENNFDLGECFCDIKCIHGHPIRLFNLGSSHYAACDSCRSYTFLGENIMSSWRNENNSLWQKNSNSIKGYKFIK